MEPILNDPQTLFDLIEGLLDAYSPTATVNLTTDLLDSLISGLPMNGSTVGAYNPLSIVQVVSYISNNPSGPWSTVEITVLDTSTEDEFHINVVGVTP